MKTNTSTTSILKHLSSTGVEAFQTLPCRYGTKAIPSNPCLRDMALCHVTLPPNGETEGKPAERCHYHKRMTEVYCFLSGSGSILLNGTWCPVQARSVVAVPPMTYHTVRSGEHGLTMLVWTNPAYQAADSFSLSELPQQGFCLHDPACIRPLIHEINRGDLQLGYFYESADFYLALASLEPEASIARHQHDVEEEAYYILEGHAEVTLGSNSVWVTPGTYVSIPKGIRHGITAGREGVRYYVAATPPIRQKPALRCNQIDSACLATLPVGGV